MRIVVSGATGYIASLLIARLLQKGEDVLAVTRKANDKLYCLEKDYKNKFQICEIITDDLYSCIYRFKPDVIYSTTCCYETDSKYLEKTIDANYTFPATLLKAVIGMNSENQRIIRFINIGTSLPSSLNLYSLTKKHFSELGEVYANLGKVCFVNVLLESFYGYGEPQNRFIQKTIINLLKNSEINCTEGKQTRDYVSVADVIDILVFLSAVKIEKNYDVIPLGSGTAPSIKDLILYMKEVSGSKSVINFGAVPARLNEPCTVADLTRLRELGYKKELKYWKTGLKELIGDIKNEVFD